MSYRPSLAHQHWLSFFLLLFIFERSSVGYHPLPIRHADQFAEDLPSRPTSQELPDRP